jgi:outer membrane protein assembly factor BamB
VAIDGKLICASRESGQIYWIHDMNAGYVPRKKGGLWGIGARTVPKPLWTNPILVNNRLILASSTGQVEALNAKTGEVERKVEVGAPVLIGPIAAGNMVYVLTDNSQLIALR